MGRISVIYLLEDDDSIRDFVIYTLNSQGMEARAFLPPSLFWQAVGEQMPALVLLDIMPAGGGWTQRPEKLRPRPARPSAGHHADGQGHGVRQGGGSGRRRR